MQTHHIDITWRWKNKLNWIRGHRVWMHALALALFNYNFHTTIKMRHPAHSHTNTPHLRAVSIFGATIEWIETKKFVLRSSMVVVAWCSFSRVVFTIHRKLLIKLQFLNDVVNRREANTHKTSPSVGNAKLTHWICTTKILVAQAHSRVKPPTKQFTWIWMQSVEDGERGGSKLNKKVDFVRVFRWICSFLFGKRGIRVAGHPHRWVRSVLVETQVPESNSREVPL